MTTCCENIHIFSLFQIQVHQNADLLYVTNVLKGLFSFNWFTNYTNLLFTRSFMYWNLLIYFFAQDFFLFQLYLLYFSFLFFKSLIFLILFFITFFFLQDIALNFLGLLIHFNSSETFFRKKFPKEIIADEILDGKSDNF